MKRIVMAIIMGILIALSFLYAKNTLFGKVSKPYGISGAIAMHEIDLLFLGSSCFRQGIDIQELENNGLNKSFLLAFNGNEPVYEVAELRCLLAAGCSIKQICMDMNPFIAQSEPRLSDVRILQDLDFDTKRFLWRTISMGNHDISIFYEFWCQANNEYFATYPLVAPIINSRYYKGGATDFKAGTTTEKLCSESKSAHLGKLNARQLDGIRAINQLCVEYGIRLCFIEPLIYTELQENESYQRIMAEYKAFLDEEKIPYLLDERFDINFSDETLFTNFNHASSKGRTEFARALASVLREAY